MGDVAGGGAQNSRSNKKQNSWKHFAFKRKIQFSHSMRIYKFGIVLSKEHLYCGLWNTQLRKIALLVIITHLKIQYSYSKNGKNMHSGTYYPIIVVIRIWCRKIKTSMSFVFKIKNMNLSLVFETRKTTVYKSLKK